MQEPIKNWIDLWEQNDLWWSLKLCRTNVELFLRLVAPIVQFKKSDVILNIGCGPGRLETLLAPQVEAIMAVDASKRLVEMCKEVCRMHRNVSVKVLGLDYTDLSLCGRSFSLILCVSVVQYYKDISEVEALIRSAQKIVLPGAKMLIADLPLKRNIPGFVWDAFCSLMMSIKEGYTFELLRAAYAVFLRKSEFRSLNRPENLLSFTFEEIDSLIKRMRLDAAIIRQSLSVYSNRPSILINL